MKLNALSFVKSMLFLTLLSGSATYALAQQSDAFLPLDSAVRVGRLDNGLTYYIRHNEYPANVADFYIAQRVGSINEDDHQRGLAHFLEHMAFNGSEHFDGNGIIDYTRTLGVQFGRNLNAYTSFDETVYNICDVPTARQSALDSCLLVLKDWSCGLTLADEEIDKERGVIHQEWQMHASASQRFYEKHLPDLLPGSKYGNRLPIGLMSVVDSFPYQALRDYYKKWYRPDNQAIIVVGDVDVDHTESVIKSLWGGITIPADAAQVKAEAVPDNREPVYVYYADQQQPYTVISMAMKGEAWPREMRNTMDYVMFCYMTDMVCSMINARLDELSQLPDAAFAAAEVEYGELCGITSTKNAMHGIVVPKEGHDMDALATICRELLRARRFGFSATEYERARQTYLSGLELSYTNKDKTKNDVYYRQCLNNYLNNAPMMGIERMYAMMSEQALTVSVGMVNEMAARLISESDSNFIAWAQVQEKEGRTYDTTDDLRRTIEAVRAEHIEAYVDNVKDEPLVARLPKKGRIKKTTENKQLGYKTLTLSNGARVVLKKTDFKDDEVRFSSYAEGGKNLFGQSDYINLRLASDVVNACALGGFTVTELTKALAGKNLSVEFGMGNYLNGLGGRTAPKDIETFMQLVYLYHTALSSDTLAIASMLSQTELALKNKYLRPEAVFSDTLSYALSGYDERSKPLMASDISRVDADRCIAMAQQLLCDASRYTFTFVGNFDEATLLPLIEQYIAALPSQRKPMRGTDISSSYHGVRQCFFTEKMQTPKAMLYSFWTSSAQPFSLEGHVMSDAVGQLLSMKLLRTIREDASAAYSVGARNSTQVLHDKSVRYTLQAGCPMDPAKAQLAYDLMMQGTREMGDSVDAGDLQKVKEYMLKRADTQARDNGHWVGVIEDVLRFDIDMQSDYKVQVNALTPEKVAQFVRDVYFASGNNLQVMMTPAE